MDQQVAVAAVISLSAAGGFAVSNALQHRAAGGVPRGVSNVGRVLLHLTRNPWWLVGTAVSFVAMLLHATALRWGSLAFVQPLLWWAWCSPSRSERPWSGRCPGRRSYGRSRSPRRGWRPIC